MLKPNLINSSRVGFSSEIFLLCFNLRIIESLQNWVSKFVNLSTDVNIPEKQKKSFCISR